MIKYVLQYIDQSATNKASDSYGIRTQNHFFFYKQELEKHRTYEH